MGGKGSKAKKEEPQTQITFEDKNGAASAPAPAPAPADKKSDKKAAKQDKKADKKADKKQTDKLKESKSSEDVVVALPDSVEDNNAEAKAVARVQSKKITGRLAIDISKNAAFANETPEEPDKHAKSSKLFKAQQEEHSRIYKALNPDKLFYESRREKEEADKIQVGRVGSRDWNMLRDEDGNVIPDDSSDEEEAAAPDEADYDTDNAPDFGEFEEEMKALRERRAAAEEERRSKMRAEWEAKKAAEEAERQAELKRIQEKEAELKKRQEENKEDFVEDRIQKVASETDQYLRQFSFRT